MSAEGRPLRESNDMDLAPSCHQNKQDDAENIKATQGYLLMASRSFL